VRAAPTITPWVASFCSSVCLNTTFCTAAPVTLSVHLRAATERLGFDQRGGVGYPNSRLKPSKRSSPLNSVATGASTTTTDCTDAPETSLEENTIGVRRYGSTPAHLRCAPGHATVQPWRNCGQRERSPTWSS